MPSSQFQGYIDKVVLHDGVIYGWAVDLKNPLRTVTLHILMDRQEVMQVTCDIPRPDVRDTLNLNNDRLGFQLTLPENAFDGQEHEISLRFADRTALPFPDESNPQHFHDTLLISPQTTETYQSHLDGLHNGFLRGWVVSRTAPNTPWTGDIAIKATVDGLPLGTFKANRYRGDIVEAFGGAPNCGFEIPIPQRFCDGLPHEFAVSTLPDHRPLAGSPQTSTIADDLLTIKLVQFENTIAHLHQQLTVLRREARALIPHKPANLQDYDKWAREYYALLAEKTALQRAAHPLKTAPLVSVLCPTWRPDEGDFRAAIESVLNQTYQNWELIIIDDGSKCPQTKAIIKEFCEQDKRIHAVTLKTNQGIANATNAGIRKARGDYIAFFDHDDLLENVALEVMMRAALHTGAKLLYCDEDKIDAVGHFMEPNLKPDFDYRYLLGCNYICHLTIIEAKTLKKIGLLETNYNGAQDHDFILRATEVLTEDEIHHVPEILYHWRKTPNSTAARISNKGYAVQAGVDCVKAHLKRRKINAHVSSIDQLSLYEIKWPFRRRPSVSIIIPFRDQLTMTKRCVESLLGQLTYSKYNIILVDNFSTDPDTLSWLESVKTDKRISVLRVEEPFNYARLNNLAAQQSKSDFLLFLNNDVIINQPDFLSLMVMEALAAPTIGAVGAQLLYPNGTIQHSGVAVGPGVIGVHTHRLQPGTAFGYIGRIRLSHQVTAVTGAAMLVPHALFTELGGFDETHLAIAYNDVDICLKIRSQGYKIIYCGEAIATHYESLSRGSDDRPEHEDRFFHETQLMRERWGENPLFKKDPTYPHYFRQDLRTFFDLHNPDKLWS